MRLHITVFCLWVAVCSGALYAAENTRMQIVIAAVTLFASSLLVLCAKHAHTLAQGLQTTTTALQQTETALSSKEENLAAERNLADALMPLVQSAREHSVSTDKTKEVIYALVDAANESHKVASSQTACGDTDRAMTAMRLRDKRALQAIDIALNNELLGDLSSYVQLQGFRECLRSTTDRLITQGVLSPHRSRKHDLLLSAVYGKHYTVTPGDISVLHMIPLSEKKNFNS